MAVQDIYSKEYDVVIIGGGATGAGTARDCALRGLRTLLVERNDYCTGATGRNHGLLHSGGRYAVKDAESAVECIGENLILKRIARHCIESTDGLFISLPGDDPDYRPAFVQSCLDAGIDAQEIDGKEALALEPNLNPEVTGAVRVPDGSVDPFSLTVSNLIDAYRHGAVILNYHEVEGIEVEQDRVTGVLLINKRTGEHPTVHCRVAVNACGIWCHRIAAMAGVNIDMYPARGAMLIVAKRLCHAVVNRCRKPANGDILVPDDTVCVIGTTSEHIPIEKIDDMRVTRDEVDVLLREGSKIAPAIMTTRILRAYAGVRPLVASDGADGGRDISRGIVCMDHKQRDGLEGLVTITGGKLMTYRLMAEQATDLVCAKLGNTAACTTDSLPLPGSEDETNDRKDPSRATVTFGQRAATHRHGNLATLINPTDDVVENALVCECSGVSVGEIKYAASELNVRGLASLRRRTRLGMGPCQGKICAVRAASLLGEFSGDMLAAQSDLAFFMGERWKGIRPVAWGDTLREAQISDVVYEGLCGLDTIIKNSAGYVPGKEVTR